MAGMRGKCDPSRGGGRGRRVDGRGGRDVLPDCADDGRWRPEQTGADRPTGTAACSRHDRGHTPRRRRRDGCTDGRLSGGGAGPRRRSARGDLRLDNGPEPWHNSSDRLGLSELGAVTRVRLGYNRALTPRLSPLSTLPERSAGGQRRGRGRRRSPWTQRARPQGAWKTAKNAVSHSAHSHLSSPYIKIHGKTGARADQVDECQEFVSFRRPLTRATERGPFRPFGFDDGVRLRTAGALRGPPPENVHHTAGPLTLERAYYPCDACRRGRCPRDQALGLQATSLSPATTRMVGLTAAEVSFAKASELLMVLAGVDVETRQVERTAEALGREVSDDERAVTEQTAPAPAPTVYLGLDGTGIPVRPAEVEGRRGKQPDGSAKTREVKLVNRVDGRRARQTGPAPPRPPGRSATTPRSRARPAATPTRSRPPSRNASIARLNGAASTPRPAGSSWATAPPGSGTCRPSSFRRHRNRRHLPCQTTSVRRGQGHLRRRDGPGRAVGQGPAWGVGRRTARRPRHGAAHPDRDHARGPQVHPLCIREPTPDALSAVPCQGPVHFFGRRRGRMQADRRTAQARRYALDHRWRQRHHRPALLPAQRPLRGLLGAASRKRRLKRHLTNLSCTPGVGRCTASCGAAAGGCATPHVGSSRASAAPPLRSGPAGDPTSGVAGWLDMAESRASGHDLTGARRVGSAAVAE